MRPSQRRLALVALAACLTACGSTVQTTSSAVGGGDGPGLSTSGDGSTSGALDLSTSGTSGTNSGTGSSSGTTTGDLSTSGSGGMTGGRSSTGSGSTTGLDPSPSGTVPPVAATGLGVTAKTISVGFGYGVNGDTANAAIGGGGLTSGDELSDEKALVDEVNSHGGVAGRKLVGVFHPTDSTSTKSGATQDQEACTDFTVDHKVIAVFSNNLTDVLPSCLAKAGVVFQRGGVVVGEDTTFLKQHPLEFLLGTLNQDRYLKDMLGSFQRQGYYGGWNTISGAPGPAAVKLAVISADPAPFERAVKRTLLPGLAAAGHAVPSTEVYFVHKPASTADVSGSTAQIQNALLKMEQTGVTHVVFNDASGLILGLFATNANTQNYYPRFGVTSGAGVQAIHDTGLATSKQLIGMSGTGWLPNLDLPSTASAPYSTSETKRCLAILKARTGQTYSSTNAATIALGDCAQVFLFTQAMKHAPSLSPRGLAAGIEALGSTFVSPLLPKAHWSATQHDEGVEAFDLSWIDSCTCVKYGPGHLVP